VISGFSAIATGDLITSDAEIQPGIFGRGPGLFLQYAERAPKRMRPWMDGHIPNRPVPTLSLMRVKPDSELGDQAARRRMASYAHLPLIADTGKFGRSLTFRLRLRAEVVQSAKSADHTRSLKPLTGALKRKMVSLESVIAVFAISQDFSCDQSQYL
jgi:hypothetical protein